MQTYVMERHDPPLFSIITVTYNAAGTIESTLDSVDRQTFSDYEHLVIDGDSTDGTQDIVKNTFNPNRKLVSERDRGIYDAMNKGMSLARGRYLIFLNAGDRLHAANTLQIISEAIRQNDFPGIVYGQTNIIDCNGNMIGPRHLTAPDNLTLKSFAQGMVVCHQSFVVLREIADGFSPKYRFSSDYDWCIKCLQHSKHNVGLTDTVVTDFLAGGTTSQNHIKSLIERFKIMCHYYGTIPTIGRHFIFFIRALKRKL